MTGDPFFTLTNNSEWNALIGRQGDPANYADGYIEAALDLANLIIRENRIRQRDTLVLPILYNARHSIELHLKLIIAQLVDVGILNAGHVQNHDIASHLQYLNECRIPDLACRSLLNHLQPYVESLAKVDDDGQELRYFTNRDGQRSLEDRALVNIAVIRDSLVTLKVTLENLKDRTIDLCYEFQTHTSTNRLSRKDLFALARMLPKRAEWSDPKFDDCKVAIKEHFEIGNQQFSLALDLIQERRELKVIIGVETPLAHLSDEKAIFLAEQWRAFHPPREERESWTVHFDIDLENQGNEKEALDAIVTKLSLDEIADAETIYYLSRNREYSERYEGDLDRKKKEYRASGDLRMEAFNLMQKTNFLSEFTRGIAMLGRIDMLDKLKII